MKATTQLEKDIAFCIDELELTDYQIGELLRATEKLGNIPVNIFVMNLYLIVIEIKMNLIDYMITIIYI